MLAALEANGTREATCTTICFYSVVSINFSIPGIFAG